ncbi:MAG: hypothetical protein ACRYFZ_18720 [Janthinobacterium lividum]
MEFFNSESLGLIATGLILVGVLKFIYYYKSFSVEILRYVDASEIVTLFADNIAIAGTVIIVLLAPYLYSIFPYLQSNVNIASTFGERIGNYWHVMHYHIYYQFFLCVIGFIIVLTRKNIFSFERWTYLALAVILFCFIPFVTLEAGHWAVPVIKPASVVAIALVVNFVLVILIATRNEIIKVKKYRYFASTVVKFEKGSDLLHPEGAYFIGKVKSFIFFYHPVDKCSIACSTSKLESIIYKP